MTAIFRRFVEVEGRRVHFRYTGNGPPILLIHASPANSEMLVAEMTMLSDQFTCIAFDTPGFGDSNPLPGSPDVADLARATGAAMSAINLPPCPIFGTHSGALIGLELAIAAPHQTTGLVLDGLPIFTDAEIAEIFDGYFKSFPPEPLAGHLTNTWMRFRDQFTWFPWSARHVTRLNAIDRPSPEDVHHWVMMYFRAWRSSLQAYKAICYYGQRAIKSAQSLLSPAIFMASEEDMLFGHLDRLPPLQPNQFIRRLAYDWPAKYASIKTFISGMEQAAGFSLPDPGFVGTSPGLQFFDTEHGQVLIRAFGPSDKPCLILLHDAPGSGRSLLPLAEKLAQLYYIIVPDLPGNGDSQPPVEPISMAVAGADAIARIVDKLQLQSFTLAAMGCSAIVAAEYLRRGDPRLAMTYVTDLPAFDLVGAEALQSELTPTSEGGHWLRAWQIVRDNQIYQPWFNGTIAAQRKTQGNFDADWLHEETFELMKSARTYHLLAKEALSTDLRQLFATWTDRVRILAPGETLEIIIGADRADQL